MVPFGIFRVCEAQLLVGRLGDFHAVVGNVPSLVGGEREANLFRVGDHKAVTTIGGIHQ
ncbi:hypothetical protein D3C81_2020600 [compost metagenome]